MRRPLLNLILAALAAEGCQVEEGEVCIQAGGDQATCPAAEEVSEDAVYLLGGDCDAKVVQVTERLTERPEIPTGSDAFTEQCCYLAKLQDPTPFSECTVLVGRPYRVGGEVAVAAGPVAEGAAGDWQRLARAEHASVAAFLRLGRQLLALGAPMALVDGALAAARDEARHLALCQEMCERVGGARWVPGPIPVGHDPVDLASLAAGCLSEGGCGETLAAAMASEAAGRARGRAAEVWAEIAADEARHAALSWRVVAWALSVGGEPVRAALRGARPELPAATTAGPDHVAQGLLGPASTAAVCRAALAEVVLPAWRALAA